MVAVCHPGRVVTGAVSPWLRVVHGRGLSRGELSQRAGCLWWQVVSGQIVSGRVVTRAGCLVAPFPSTNKTAQHDFIFLNQYL